MNSGVPEVNSGVPEDFTFINSGCDIFILFPLTIMLPFLQDCDFVLIS
jgi:hypothetical protein